MDGVNGALAGEASAPYSLSSLPAAAKRLLAAARAHWSVENTFHWTMDAVFGEDASRVRLSQAPENFAVLRHIATNLLKCHPGKQSLTRKRLRAALDDHFLTELLTPNLMRLPCPRAAFRLYIGRVS